MTPAELLQIRDKISATLLSYIEGDVEAEHAAVTQSAKQLEQFACMGGSTRAKAEAEIVRLVERFDDTRQSAFGPWPVSAFMIKRDGQEDALRSALEACIAAHKTGRYEPMVAAIEAAQILIADTTPRRA